MVSGAGTLTAGYVLGLPQFWACSGALADARLD